MEVSSQPSLSALAELESVIEDSAKYLHRYGVIKPQSISPENREVFLSWPEERVRQTALRARKILKAHLAAEMEGCFDLDDNRQLLKVALRELGLLVDPSFFKLIERDDVVEVYDKEHIQIFRSFNFFRLSNYNLDDVLSHEWYELYEREASVTERMMACAQSHLMGPNSVSTANVPEHLIRESFSEKKGVFVGKLKKLATLYSGPERIPCFACTLSIKPLGADYSQIDFLRTRANFSSRVLKPG